MPALALLALALPALALPGVAPAALLPVALALAAVLAGAALVVAALAGAALVGTALVAVALVAVALLTALAGAFASFFAPLVTALNSAPARKAGTEVFLTLTLAPVAGLRAVRASRARFSNEPKPVSASFSPRTTTV